jgi:tetratricopeptide (TPR) repeat protein
MSLELGSERHAPFQAVLTHAKPRSLRRRRCRAGLCVMELLDHLWFEAAAYDVDIVHEAIAAAPRVIRRLLTEVVDTALEPGSERDDILEALDAYAERLAYDAEFALAAHVYRVIIDAASDAKLTWLLAPAYQHRASCLREAGELKAAMECYDMGSTHAAEINDDRTAIRLMTGRANLLRTQEKFEEALADLELSLRRAREIGDPDLIGRAAHELGICLYKLGTYVEALVSYGEAFRMFVKRRDRHRLLNDIGRTLEALGLLNEARDAWLGVYGSRKSETYAKFAAAVNLMAVAHETRDRPGFDLYRTVPRTRMPPRLLMAFFFELGEGLTVFRQRAESREAYDRAARIARRLGLTSYEAQARKAIETQRSRPARRPAPMIDLPASVTELLAEVTRLRMMPDAPRGLRRRKAHLPAPAQR